MPTSLPLSVAPPATPGPTYWSPAEFFVPEGDALLCTLCPHACRLREGETGACHVRRALGGRMETATFATSIVHLDAVERKPLYHFRPGSRALTLAAPGCSFTCHYCTNWRLSQFGHVADAPWRADVIDPDAVVAEAARSGAAVALSYSEPSLAAELTLALARAARPRGVAVLWKSNGFVTPEALGRLGPCLSAVNLDVKAADDRRHRALTGAPLAPVLEAARELRRLGVWLEVSTPVIPGFNDDDATLGRIAEQVAALGGEVPWHLLRFSPDFRMRRLAPTTPEALRRAASVGRSAGLRFVYVERALGPDGRDTFCTCGHRVVERGVWSCVKVDMRDGHCGNCGRELPGRW